MNSQRIIQTVGVSKLYNGRVWALKGVSLEVEAGEWISIMGPSGSGKTTLLNILGCLDQPTEGSVIIGGKEVSGLGEPALALFRRENVGLIFQQFHLIPYLTAVENVMLAQYFHSMPDRDEAAKALSEVGLGHRLDHLPSQLSWGEQQRVCIARALINEPRIVLADEPTGNLDKANEDVVLEIFSELHRGGKTLVVVTHDWSVGKLSDRCVELEHGRVVSG